MAAKKSNIQLLGERIEELRKERGLSMREFAELCEISKTQVNELTNAGVDFRYSTLVKIANGLGMTISELTNF
jgi:transcriptional regulator with XRE-family HTH domain